MHPYHHPLFVNFMVYFNDNQDYFECHEVLEEYWKSLPDGNKEHPLTAFILLSTGLYHWRRGNTIGALRTLRKAHAKFSTFPALYMGEIDMTELALDVQQALQQVEDGQPFHAFSLLISSEQLQTHIETTKPSMQLLPFGSDAIIHKHMLRDRSDILHERNKAQETRGARSWRLDEEKKKGRNY